MNSPRHQHGLSLITAIMIVVFLSLVAAFLVRSVGSQQALNDQNLIGLRAFHAARAGIEWGTARALAGNCTAGSALLIESVNVSVDCSSVDVTEAGTTYQVFRIDALAQIGALGTPEFAQRALSLRLSNKP